MIDRKNHLASNGNTYFQNNFNKDSYLYSNFLSFVLRRRKGKSPIPAKVKIDKFYSKIIKKTINFKIKKFLKLISLKKLLKKKISKLYANKKNVKNFKKKFFIIKKLNIILKKKIYQYKYMLLLKHYVYKRYIRKRFLNVNCFKYNIKYRRARNNFIETLNSIHLKETKYVEGEIFGITRTTLGFFLFQNVAVSEDYRSFAFRPIRTLKLFNGARRLKKKIYEMYQIENFEPILPKPLIETLLGSFLVDDLGFNIFLNENEMSCVFSNNNLMTLQDSYVASVRVSQLSYFKDKMIDAKKIINIKETRYSTNSTPDLYLYTTAYNKVISILDRQKKQSFFPLVERRFTAEQFTFQLKKNIPIEYFLKRETLYDVTSPKHYEIKASLKKKLQKQSLAQLKKKKMKLDLDVKKAIPYISLFYNRLVDTLHRSHFYNDKCIYYKHKFFKIREYQKFIPNLKKGRYYLLRYNIKSYFKGDIKQINKVY